MPRDALGARGVGSAVRPQLTACRRVFDEQPGASSRVFKLIRACPWAPFLPPASP